MGGALRIPMPDDAFQSKCPGEETWDHFRFPEPGGQLSLRGSRFRGRRNDGVKRKTRDKPHLQGRSVGTPWEVLGVAARLGITSFGGPIAHLGYFHEEYVVRRKWIDEKSYADLVALCQMIPGPASSQLGIAIGIERAGLLGGVAALIGFTLPSAIALTGFALLVHGSVVGTAGWLHGLLVVAVAVVAQAVWSMSRTLTPDAPRASIAFSAAIVSILLPASLTQILLIVAGAIVGLLLLRTDTEDKPNRPTSIETTGRVAAIACLALFVLLLIGLPVLRAAMHSQWIALIDSFYRSGSLVFGGGHVVLPLLQREVVPTGWISNESFLAGYGAAQAVPGPLFAFSAYLGALMATAPNGVLGAAGGIGGHLSPFFSAHHWTASILEYPPESGGCAVGSLRGECRRSWNSSRCALYPGVDQRDFASR